MLNAYLNAIATTAKRGDAREESFYSSLEKLLHSYADTAGLKKIDITTLPKKSEAGNPDFRVWDGKQSIVGYIEAKKPDAKLDDIQGSEQLKRYRNTYPNLILTNFLEFRLYRNGDLIDKVQIGRPFVLSRMKMAPPLENEAAFLGLLEKFLAFSLPRSYTAKSLAVELAKRTRFLKEQVIIEELREEQRQGSGFLTGFYEAFQTYLIGGLALEDFADLYSQTITYGLFAARSRASNGFTRKSAFDSIPQTIGILRDIFRFVSLGDLPRQMEVIVDDISEVLAVADVNQILHKYYHEGKGKDPVIHFYETFLAEYDPSTRERRGVYYTPEPVVAYIVRSLHQVLKSHFDRADGFATASVRVLDPAAGTLTFLAEAAKLAVEEFTAKYGDGADSLVHDHILRDFYAFELMMAPYAIGHLKMAFLLEELGYRLGPEERFKLYLTNTLEMEELEKSRLPGMTSLAEESALANAVKRETPILVVLGNPPYSGHSSNVGKEISEMLRAYYQVDGKPLGEKNPKWLQDDYVKFIRFAQWKIEQAGEGVLGFITNHSYLDNPTFRGMRQSLMNTFDEMYLLDLHGNSLKKEKCPDDSTDENVFDIRQGVAVAILIKKPGAKKVIKHAQLWGRREEKYDWLAKNSLASTSWEEIKPQGKFYLFVPRDESLAAQYETFPRITDIFPVNSVGIVTSRDQFVVDFDRKQLEQRMETFRGDWQPDDMIKVAFKLKEKPGWRVATAREALRKDAAWQKAFTKVLYRPFDSRHIFYHDAMIERPRKAVMCHMLHSNIGLILNRQVRLPRFEHALVTESVTDFHVLETANANPYVFPLYLYENGYKASRTAAVAAAFSIFDDAPGYEAKRPNLSDKLVARLTAAYGKALAPQDVFYYVYGVLYSPSYRGKYVEFLKTDFPRIPFTANVNVFRAIASLGEKLTQLHLLKSAELESPAAKFAGRGANRVEKPMFDEITGRVAINDNRYFEGIQADEWNYQIGGYQVLRKWLIDRKGRELSAEDIRHYCRTATAIRKTIELQQELDVAYAEVEFDTIALTAT